MILLVRSSNINEFRYWHIIALLNHLGIPYAQAYLSENNVNAELRTPAGNFAPNSASLRNYFKQHFDAVLVLDNANTIVAGLFAAVHWLQWNDFDDPPIVYLGWHFSTNYTALDSFMPSDFPLRRPINAEINSAVSSQTQPASAVILEPWSAVHDIYEIRTGTAIRFLRESIDVIIPAWCWRNSSGYIGAWRTNTSHAALADTPYTHRVAPNGRAGEILAVPAPQPDLTYPNDAVLAYRYRNRFLLPQAMRDFAVATPRHVFGMTQMPSVSIFWVLYALKLCRVRPQRVLPLLFECDHPIEYSTELPDTVTFAIFRDVWDWTREFCRQTGMVVHCGVTTGGMSRRRTDTHGNLRSPLTSHHWCLINGEQYGFSSAAAALARQVHEVLLAGHREGTLPCGFHDHTIAMLGNANSGRGLWGDTEYQNLRRHSASDYAHLGLSFPLEAPNIIRIRRGRICCAKHVMPAGALLPDAIEQRIGETEYYEQDFASNAYSDNTINLGSVPAGSLHIARLVIESSIAEMRAMGFPDGHGGEHGYTNTAANNSGGDYYWQALREYGYKAVRTNYYCNSNGGTARNKAIPPSGIWKSFHLIHQCTGLDVGGYGLFHPNFGWHAVSNYGVNVSGDISTNWPNTAWVAHRRVIGKMTTWWLMAVGGMLQTVYMHPSAFFTGASPSQPTARFNGMNLLNYHNQPHWNPHVEVLENMRGVIQLLSDYLKFGSITDLIMIREQILS